jgi:hypothetical protein
MEDRTKEDLLIFADTRIDEIRHKIDKGDKRESCEEREKMITAIANNMDVYGTGEMEGLPLKCFVCDTIGQEILLRKLFEEGFIDLEARLIGDKTVDDYIADMKKASESCSKKNMEATYKEIMASVVEAMLGAGCRVKVQAGGKLVEEKEGGK